MHNSTNLLKKFKLPEGQLSGEIWLQANQGVITDASGRLDWNHPDEKISMSIALKHQGSENTWQSTWLIDEIKLGQQAVPAIEVLAQRTDDVSDFFINQIPLEMVTVLVRDMVPEQQMKLAQLQTATGSINRFNASYDHQTKSWPSASFLFDDWSVTHEQFSFAGLAGEVALLSRSN